MGDVKCFIKLSLNTFRGPHYDGFSSFSILLLVYQIGTALDHIHNVGVIHRDVKMENILVAEGEINFTSVYFKT